MPVNILGLYSLQMVHDQGVSEYTPIYIYIL